MPKAHYRDRVIDCRPGENLLDAGLRQGVDLHFSCRGGSCHSCLSLCTEGEIPPRAQRGIKPELAAKGYFLPCVCVPESDLRFEPPHAEDLYTRAVVRAHERLSQDVWRLRLETYTQFDYRPGQSLNLRGPGGTVRSFSLASDPESDPYLELHIKRIEGGALSPWLCDRLAVDDEVDIQGPNGDFVYAEMDPDRPLLFVVTGTGLAPALGVIRDALRRGHRGPIHLYHGSRRRDGLYLREDLKELAAAYGTLHYHACLSSPTETAEGVIAGRAHLAAARAHPDLRGWRVHLAGVPAMVTAAAAMFRDRGAADADIVADPFESPDDAHLGAVLAAHIPERSVPSTEEVRQPAADPEIWAALDAGERLWPILDEFYTRVFEDPLLSPFFHGTTKRRAIEKVFSFLQQVFTGNKVYFGDRPRNAHHWMTISNQLFDYREEMFFEVVRKYGLPEPLIQRWRTMQEAYRADIVKSDPWPKVVEGVALPLDGFGTIVLDVGSVCDGCAGEIHVGETARYHLRLGTAYCPACAHSEATEAVAHGA